MIPSSETCIHRSSCDTTKTPSLNHDEFSGEVPSSRAVLIRVFVCDPSCNVHASLSTEASHDAGDLFI